MLEPHWRSGGRLVAAISLALTLVGLAGASRAETPESFVLLGADPTASRRVVHQAEWAAELVDALGISAALPEDHDATDLFGLLCADHLELAIDAGGRRVPARSSLRVSGAAPPQSDGPLRIVLSVPATALYALTVDGAGPQRWAVDGRPLGHLDPSPLGVAQAPTIVALRRGPHELAAFLGRRSQVDQVELSAYRPLCIAPAEGWHAERPLTFGAKARTMVRAFGLERRLRADGDGKLIEGERFSAASAWGGLTNRRLAVPASAGAWATATGSPAEFTYRVRLDDPGVFTLLARVSGGAPQIWSVDGRHRVSVQAEVGKADFDWIHVLTLELASGEHVIRAMVPRGAGIDLLRLIPRRSSDADYIDVLGEVGFQEGAPSALVTRAAATANLSNPSFAEFADGFLPRLAGDPSARPLSVVEAELEMLYSRPLSPVLPPEL